ncbi:MAG: hypothetical protein V4616_00520 [Bacteroidota bacterium]
MVKRYFFLSLLALSSLAAVANNPRSTLKRSSSLKTQALVELVRSSGKSFILQSRTASSQPISFMITDSRGVVVMFGDNYRSGEVLNLSHFQSGNYTMYFDNKTNSAAAYFTLGR